MMNNYERIKAMTLDEVAKELSNSFINYLNKEVKND